MNVSSILEILVSVAKKKSTQLVAVSAASASLGAAGTYFAVSKRLETKYSEIAEKEILEAKDYYARVNRSQISLDDLAAMASKYQEEDDAEAARQIVMDNGYSFDAEEDFIDEELVEENTRTGFDYQQEVGRREGKDVYLITEEEYYQGEKNYSQDFLSYFEADDVLIDTTEQPIDDVDGIVGEENLARFGEGASDKNVVYIRNDRLELDVEITRSHGSYTEEVLGFIEHSDHRPGVLKFRGDRE